MNTAMYLVLGVIVLLWLMYNFNHYVKPMLRTPGLAIRIVMKTYPPTGKDVDDYKKEATVEYYPYKTLIAFWRVFQRLVFGCFGHKYFFDDPKIVNLVDSYKPLSNSKNEGCVTETSFEVKNMKKLKKLFIPTLKKTAFFY